MTGTKLDFGNMKTVRVWHEQFKSIESNAEYVSIDDKEKGGSVIFRRYYPNRRSENERYLELKKIIEETKELLKKKKENKIMSSEKFIGLCKENVMKYFNENADKTDNVLITQEDVYLVWYCKTLQNHKALLSTNISDGMYYELTYNGGKNELYLDAYKKWQNVKINLNEEE